MSAQQMKVITDAGEAAAAREIDRLADRLHPDVNRAQVLARLDDLFRKGSPPEEWPSGFLPGRLLTTSVWGPMDTAVLRITRLWMPWKGKIFDPGAKSGVNKFDNTMANRAMLKAVFPGYTPERVTADRIEAFPMRNRIEGGATDPDVQVFKIDYDFEANPTLIRHILDELVQVAPGRFLGKILFRTGSKFHPIGFFALRAP
jgi:hypothetical protein